LEDTPLRRKLRDFAFIAGCLLTLQGFFSIVMPWRYRIGPLSPLTSWIGGGVLLGVGLWLLLRYFSIDDP
jgi:hypothetical protein